MSAHKKWTQELSEIERVLQSSEEISDAKTFLTRFEAIDEKFRDEIYSHLYLKLWPVALKAAKLNLANEYARKALQYLISLKRIPKIKSFLKELHEAGLLKKQSENISRQCEILLGKKVDFHNDDLQFFNLMDDHPEHWKDFPEFTKQYLTVVNDWGIHEWKLCYEFILIHHFDKEIAYSLMEKAHESGKSNIVLKFAQLFNAKKIRVRKLTPATKEQIAATSEKLYVDYDQVAMEMLSGEKEPSDEEQRRVLNSLKFISDEELKTRGKDMVVAFELLGMEKVVLTLCERLINEIHTENADIKELASLYYLWVQALFNNGDYFKANDLIDELLAKEPFYEEERIAFLYLKAETCLKLKRIKTAKELFNIIKKFNPHYRMVRERLETLETT